MVGGVITASLAIYEDSPNLFYIGLAIFIGYLTHLIADSITLEGINFLYPFSSFRIKGLIRTGSLIESLLFFILIGFFAFIAFTVIFFVDFIVGLGKGEFPQD